MAGGYQEPGAAAPVSGPGALSQRTDGKLGVTGLPYGENAPLNEMAAGLPQGPQRPAPSVVPLDAPSQFPDEPITAGAPFGPGPGPSVQNSGRLQDLLRALAGDDISGDLADLLFAAEANGL
jgi:hypothetical protein